MLTTQLDVDPFRIFNQRIAACNPPAPPVPDWFIKELTALDGCNEFGQPIFRIVWGGSATWFAFGRTRIKYAKSKKDVLIGFEHITTLEDGAQKRTFLSIEEAKQVAGQLRPVYDWLDIGKPYFYIEEWLAPERACEGWEKNRYGPHPRTGEWCDINGPEPREGLYRDFWKMADENGEPILPDERAMEHLRAIIWRRNQDPVLYTRREKPPRHVIEAVLKRKNLEIAEFQLKEDIELVDRYYQALKPLRKFLEHEHPNEAGGKLILL